MIIDSHFKPGDKVILLGPYIDKDNNFAAGFVSDMKDYIAQEATVIMAGRVRSRGNDRVAIYRIEACSDGQRWWWDSDYMRLLNDSVADEMTESFDLVFD